MQHTSKPTLTPYEHSVLGDAVSAISPYRTPISTLVHLTADHVVDDVADADDATPDVVTQGLWRILLAMGYLAEKTLRNERLNELRRWAMRPVSSRSEIARLDLWEVDEAVRWIEPKYMLVGAFLGFGAGRFGLRGIVADKPLVTLLAMRQISEYGARYGFDLEDAEERAFAAQIFVAALNPRSLPQETGAGDLSVVVRAAKRVSRIAGMFDVLRSVVRRVVRSRAARVVPMVSAVGVAVYNAWLLRGVARTAALAYRERFVARKHHMSMEALTPVLHAAPSSLPAPSPKAEVTSSAHSEACPPDPFERKDEARRASPQSGPGR